MLDNDKTTKPKAKLGPLLLTLGLVLLVVGVIISRPYWEGEESPGVTGKAEVVDINAAGVLQLTKNLEGKVSLVNIWATWCQPCIEEFPYLLSLKEKFPNLNLILVSADVEEDRPRVLEFLAEQGVDFKTYIKAEPDGEFATALNPDWNGALPATFIYDEKGVMKRFWIGDASLEEFINAVESVQKPTDSEENP